MPTTVEHGSDLEAEAAKFSRQMRWENPIKMTRAEFDRISSLKLDGTDSPEDMQLMHEKGINLDSGDVTIEIDGQDKMDMATDRLDFGTVNANKKF